MQDEQGGKPTTQVLSILKGTMDGKKDQFGLFLDNKFLVFAQKSK